MQLESLLFLAAFIPLRSYVGGYHASSYFRCYWVSTATIIAVFVMMKLALAVFNASLLVFIGGVCAIIISVLAPVQDKNRPFDDIEKHVYGLRARIVLCIEFLIMVAFALIGTESAVTLIFCVLCLTCITACVGAVKNLLRI
jgi:accessory gene regulator B